MLRRALFVPSLLLLLAPLACRAPSRLREYHNSDLELAAAYTAKEVCSCLFVIEQTEDYCRRWTRASPDIASFRVDRKAKVVESSALLFWGARARFVSERFGCLLE